LRRAKAITSLSSEVFSEGADNKRRTLPNYAGRRNESDVSFDGAKHETSWSFSTFSEPTKRFVAL
jgi:hypothetical protein